MVERCHRQLKDGLGARSAANDWPDHLPWVLLGMGAAPKEDSAVSSEEMVLGDPLVLPGKPPAAEEPPLPQRSYRDALLGGPTRHVPTRPLPPAKSGLPATLAACTSVYVRRGGNLLPLAPLYAGPYAGPGARREGVPAAGGQQRGGGVCGPPEAAHRGGASAAGGAAEARSATRVGGLIHHCRLRTTALRGSCGDIVVYD
jgi:hypothetical protein